MITRAQMRNVIQEMVQERGAEKTVCPSEVARKLGAGGDWQALMPPVREVAFTMADRGEIDITQKGAVVDGRTAKGAIRLRLREK